MGLVLIFRTDRTIYFGLIRPILGWTGLDLNQMLLQIGLNRYF